MNFLKINSNIKLNAIPIPNPSAVMREDADGWAALINLDTAGSISLNPTGVMIWKLIDGKHNSDEIISSFKSYFEGAPPRIAEDVTALIDVFSEEGMVGYEVIL